MTWNPFNDGGHAGTKYNRDRPSGPTLTTAQWSDVQRRYAAGETSTALALEYGVTAATIRARAGRRDSAPTNMQGQNPALSAWQKTEVRSRYEAGETAASLAEEFGVSVSTVNRSIGPRNPR